MMHHIYNILSNDGDKRIHSSKDTGLTDSSIKKLYKINVKRNLQISDTFRRRGNRHLRLCSINHTFCYFVFLQTGNLYIDGRNYDLEPAPEMKFKRGFKFDEFGTPHFLVENEVAAMNYSANSTKSLEIKDTKDIDGKNDSPTRRRIQRGFG